jgi:hypothetical protein
VISLLKVLIELREMLIFTGLSQDIATNTDERMHRARHRRKGMELPCPPWVLCPLGTGTFSAI